MGGTREPIDLDAIRRDTERAARQLLDMARLRPGEILIVGCSTSEIRGERIGTASSHEVAEAVYAGLGPVVKEHAIFLAVQCCEHLNRALVVERACAERYGLEIVSVLPHLKAGGALATLAMELTADAVVVEVIAAHAGIDIGDTFIGMHLRRVAVPVRSDIRSIGQARLTMARTRPRYIGGERAKHGPDQGK
ncbi:MAG TPA: TIGR01440 family protein [Bacillota bacterium]|nr:TIGR01440 family protein [Bacillota bacterium]